MKDVLSDIFETIRLRASLYFRTDFSPPFAIQVPKYQQAARFHLVVKGQCHVELASGQTDTLYPGDLILIPRGAEHILSDQANRTPAPLETVIERSGYDGNGTFIIGEGDKDASTQMVCGHFGFTQGADHPLLRALPDRIIMTTQERAAHPLLDDTLKLVVRRMFEDDLGSNAAISRLSEVFFIETIRVAVNQCPNLARIMSAMKDKQIGEALSLIHKNSTELWTVESLARAVGMSRSSFAERFRALIGDAPMSYLSEWRLQQALHLLTEPTANIQDVAGKVGYQSAAAFSRAFTQKFGASPSDYRQLNA